MTGFYDAEGNFLIRMVRNTTLKVGWAAGLAITVRLNEKDIDILKELQAYFDGIGRVYHQETNNEAIFTVNALKEIEVIIRHFDKYSLNTKKSIDFILFKQAYLLIVNKKHLTTEGILKVANIKASMNTRKGIVDIPGIVPVDRPAQPMNDIDPNWIAGFTSGEGCFSVSLKKSKGSLGMTSFIRFILTQHSRDHDLMVRLQNFFSCGKINSDKKATYLVVRRLSWITDIVIPFFDKYTIKGNKLKDYEDFKLVAQLMNSKAHFTKEGLEQIRNIKNGMNSYR